MKHKTIVLGFVVLSFYILGLSACRGKSETPGTGENSKTTASTGLKDVKGRDLNPAEIQKQIQEQTERSVQMANQQRQMMMQQMQMQAAQQQSIQSVQQAHRQAQQATTAANRARPAGQKQ